jgi:hypothetical protein
MKKSSLAFSLSCALFALPLPAAAGASRASVLEPSQARELITVQGVTAQNGRTSGVLVNHGNTPIDGVKLVVQYQYRWPDEFKPGKRDPGTAHEFTIPGTIPPGGREPFSVASTAPAAPQRGGHFATDVKVLGFDQLEPAHTASASRHL